MKGDLEDFSPGELVQVIGLLGKSGRLDVVSTVGGWGRCSLFLLDWQPILVAEFFLPALVSSNA